MADQLGVDDLRVVCLGASAGGLEALGEFFDALPLNTGAAYVVIVHLSPDFKSLMPELLAKRTSMPVAAGKDGADLQANHVYIIPPGSNMLVREGRLRLEAQDRRPGHSLNLPIDMFLQSLADDYGSRSVAIILSGTGSDGSRGIRAIKEVGGIVLAQAFATAKFDGMLVSAAQTGMVDALGSPAELALRVQDMLSHEPLSLVELVDDGSDSAALSELFQLLARQGLDLSYLRPNMVMRRVGRRMTISGFSGVEAYLARLRTDAGECAQLASDLLIGVTQFFREPEALEVLQTRVLPNLLAMVPDDEVVRVWVTACSTGQEVYTLGILILEAMEMTGLERELKLFATDVDERALQRGSRGVYTLSEVADVKPALLSRYFEQREGQFSVRPTLRRRVIFARHNLVTDPPFTKIDLVTCRNLLIYLRPEVQRRVLASFYHALQPGHGVLMLGASEEVGSLDVAFPPINRRAKLFTRGPNAPDELLKYRAMLREPGTVTRVEAQPPPKMVGTVANTQARLLRSVLELNFEAEHRSAALIDADFLLVDVLTDCLGVFRLPKGKPTQDLARILPSGLMTGLHAARQRLLDGSQAEGPARVVIPAEGSTAHALTLQALPDGVESAPQWLLVIQALTESSEVVVTESSVVLGAAERIASLEQELRLSKESLQSTIEELQSSNEEQQSTNEELVASNEELQSTNEELHSVNEELYTVNAEYRKRNEELLIVTADLENLLRSTSVATLYLDPNLRIRRFTPSITRLIPLRESDLSRPLGDFTHQLDVDLAQVADRVRATGETIEREVRDRAGAWLLLRASRYEDASGEGQGVLLTFVDVTRIKNAEETARAMGDQLANTNALLAEQAQELEALFANVAKGLKPSIDAFRGTLKELSSNAGSQAPAELLRRALVAVEEQSVVLTDLSTVSELAGTDAVRTRVDVPRWLDELLRPYAERAEREGGGRLQWACDRGHARFASKAASVVLTSLIENAFARTSPLPHGQRRVDVLCQMDANFARFIVADSGPVISKENASLVFALPDRNGPAEGLSLCFRLVAARRMAWRAKGSLDFDRTVEHGAKFVLELPLGPASEQSVRDVPPAPRNVLVVEDDPVDAKRARLALHEFDISTVGTLVDATRKVNEFRYGLIVLDLSLPDGHGLGLLSRLRGGPNRAVPVVLMTGHSAGLDQNVLRGTNVVTTINKEDESYQPLVDAVERYVGVDVVADPRVQLIS